MKYWQKYLILPHKTPIKNVEILKNLTMPVVIIACRNDMCHPFEFGEYLHKFISQSEFIEIPSKDADNAKHKFMINDVIKKILQK